MVQGGRSEPVSGVWRPEFPVNQGKNREFLHISAESGLLEPRFSSEFNRLAANSLNFVTGKNFKVTGNFRDETGNSGPDQAQGTQPGGRFKSGARNQRYLQISEGWLPRPR